MTKNWQILSTWLIRGFYRLTRSITIFILSFFTSWQIDKVNSSENNLKNFYKGITLCQLSILSTCHLLRFFTFCSYYFNFHFVNLDKTMYFQFSSILIQIRIKSIRSPSLTSIFSEHPYNTYIFHIHLYHVFHILFLLIFDYFCFCATFTKMITHSNTFVY